jgi:PAS domain S-box-containing protein
MCLGKQKQHLLRESGRMLLFDIAALLLLLSLGAGLVLQRRHALQNQKEARVCQSQTLEAVKQRLAAERALRLSQASLQSLVDNAPFGICRTSIAGDRFDTLNSTLREMLGGYSPEEALQLKISKNVWADSKDRSRMIELARRNFTIKGFETTFRRRDGSPLPVRLSGSFLQDADGSEHFEGYVEDMTQQSTLEQ